MRSELFTRTVEIFCHFFRSFGSAVFDNRSSHGARNEKGGRDCTNLIVLYEMRCKHAPQARWPRCSCVVIRSYTVDQKKMPPFEGAGYQDKGFR